MPTQYLIKNTSVKLGLAVNKPLNVMLGNKYLKLYQAIESIILGLAKKSVKVGLANISEIFSVQRVRVRSHVKSPVRSLVHQASFHQIKGGPMLFLTFFNL